MGEPWLFGCETRAGDPEIEPAPSPGDDGIDAIIVDSEMPLDKREYGVDQQAATTPMAH
jgi:hypothetical protein